MQSNVGTGSFRVLSIYTNNPRKNLVNSHSTVKSELVEDGLSQSISKSLRDTEQNTVAELSRTPDIL